MSLEAEIIALRMRINALLAELEILEACLEEERENGKD